MEIFSALLVLCHRWIPLTRPVTRSFDVFVDLRLNKRLNKQSWGWWFETPSCSFWSHCNVRGDDRFHLRGWVICVTSFQALNIKRYIISKHVCYPHMILYKNPWIYTFSEIIQSFPETVPGIYSVCYPGIETESQDKLYVQISRGLNIADCNLSLFRQWLLVFGENAVNSSFFSRNGPNSLRLETHICVGYLTIIGSYNRLSSNRRQTIIWTNAGILSIESLGTNLSEILIETYTFSFKKMNLKMSSGRYCPLSRPKCVKPV